MIPHYLSTLIAHVFLTPCYSVTRLIISYFYFNFFYPCKVRNLWILKVKNSLFKGKRMGAISISLPLWLNLNVTALKPRCLEQCVSLHINYCASVCFLCGFPNPKNHFNQICRVQNIQRTFQRFVRGTIQMLYQIQISATYVNFRSCPMRQKWGWQFCNCGKRFPIRFQGLAIRNTEP
jgi:hypothetical protein